MSIEALKEEARRHEQNEEWLKAVRQYKEAIRLLENDDQPDIGLYNRVADLLVRVGNIDDAITHYERAVDLYVEAYLPNNAIAICKKVIRNLPNRPSIYLKMGQVRASQGFLKDARTNFLTYAERMQKAGDLDESFRALVEFCDLAPEDVDVRLAVADQMVSHDRITEAVEQLSIAYRALMGRGNAEQAAEVEQRIRQLNPDADLDAPSQPDMVITGSSLVGDGGLGGMDSGGGDPGRSDDTLPSAALDDDESTAFDLPLMSFDDDEAAGDGLPMMGFEEPVPEATEPEAAPLPTEAPPPAEEAREEAREEAVAEAREEPRHEAPVDAGADVAGQHPQGETLESIQAAIDRNPNDVALHQRKVELAYLGGGEGLLAEAYLGLAGALTRGGEDKRAAAAYRQVLVLDPGNSEAKAALGEQGPPSKPVPEVLAQEEYVDLGSLLLGEVDQKDTRMRVAYQEPTGDEAADFAKMLSQFKDGVSANIDVDDVRSHHDLGVAYKEMGLLNEAIAEFQQALRASADHLPSYELLGQSFMEARQPDAAVRTLRRALERKHAVEDELIGIYYHLGRAHEALGEKEAAVEYYDRVFALDINFADVTERLRALR